MTQTERPAARPGPAGDTREQLDLGVLLRALRRQADLSQRQLAARSGVPKSTISRIEAGRAGDPRFRTVERLVLAAGAMFGLDRPLPLPVPQEGRQDAAGRNYPAHLDLREVRTAKDWSAAWWAHWYTLPPERWPVRVPEATFDLCRERRDRRRHREDVGARARVRMVTEALPEDAWQWVAELPDGELVGELRAHLRGCHPAEPDHPGREVVLDGVLVAPNCRGVGIGRRLVAELVAQMDRSGMAVARAFVESDGLEFLVRCGFRVEATRSHTLTLERYR